MMILHFDSKFWKNDFIWFAMLWFDKTDFHSYSNIHANQRTNPVIINQLLLYVQQRDRTRIRFDFFFVSSTGSACGILMHMTIQKRSFLMVIARNRFFACIVSPIVFPEFAFKSRLAKNWNSHVPPREFRFCNCPRFTYAFWQHDFDILKNCKIWTKDFDIIIESI